MKTVLAGVLAACALAAFSAGCGNAAEPKAGAEAAPSLVISLSDTNFAAQVKEGVVLVDFYAAWCGPCRRQAPIVEQVAAQLKGKARVAKVNVDEAQKTAARYGIQGIPALVVFKDGKPVSGFEGLTEAQELLAAVKGALGESK
jgi:thioredoxin 1